MGYAGLIRRTGQTLDLIRPTPGAKDAHGTRALALPVVARGLPCLATEQVGREVLTPSGERAIANWDVMLLPGAPPVFASDRLVLHPGNIALDVITAINPTLGHTKAAAILARSGGRP